MQTVNSNQEVKPDSKIRALKLLLYVPLYKSWDTKLPSWLKEKNRQVWMMLEMINKCNETKNTSARNRNRVRVRQKAITNTRDCFEIRAPSSTFPLSPCEEFALSTKKLSQKNYKVYTRLGVHNSNLQSST